MPSVSMSMCPIGLNLKLFMALPRPRLKVPLVNWFNGASLWLVYHITGLGFQHEYFFLITDIEYAVPFFESKEMLSNNGTFSTALLKLPVVLWLKKNYLKYLIVLLAALI